MQLVYTHQHRQLTYKLYGIFDTLPRRKFPCNYMPNFHLDKANFSTKISAITLMYI